MIIIININIFMNKKIILIMGLPGTGKSTLANELHNMFLTNGHLCDWYNADKIRQEYNDWDFSYDGRLRQAERMKNLANMSEHTVIIDMVAPLPEFRSIINPNVLVWMDTLVESRFEDTNKLFVQPENYNYRITSYDSQKWAKNIYEDVTENIIDFLLLYT